MSATSNLITLVVIAGVGAVGFAIFKAKLAGQQAAGARFKAKALLTTNEMEFRARLEAAAPELRFFPQVAMGALIDPAVSRSDRKVYYRLRGMFSQKIVDFVAQRRSDGGIALTYLLAEKLLVERALTLRPNSFVDRDHKCVSSLRSRLVCAPVNCDVRPQGFV